MSPAREDNHPGNVGKRIPTASAALRPRPLDEVEQWGGQDMVRGRRVLDLGCGDGRFALGIAHLTSAVEGVDPDADAIAAANRAARDNGLRNARFAVGTAQRLPYRDGVFDVVILSWTL